MPPSPRTARRGNTAIEFALIAPVLLLLFAGITTFSWTFLMQSSVVDAVAEGARRGAVLVGDPAEPFGDTILEVSRTATEEALLRAGWSREQFTVTTRIVWQDGFSLLEVTAEAGIATRWAGLLFPVPDTAEYTVTVATVDQPEAP